MLNTTKNGLALKMHSTSTPRMQSRSTCKTRKNVPNTLATGVQLSPPFHAWTDPMLVTCSTSTSQVTRSMPRSVSTVKQYSLLQRAPRRLGYNVITGRIKPPKPRWYKNIYPIIRIMSVWLLATATSSHGGPQPA